MLKSLENISVPVLLLLMILLCNCTYAQDSFNIAFYYGDNPPVDELHAFDVVVFEPSSGVSPKSFNTPYSKPYAYVSVGETGLSRRYEKPLKEEWFIGRNKIWDARVIDQSNPEWQEFFLDHVIAPLWKQGYHGFLLDTLDSYQLVAKTPEAKQKQIDGLIKNIQGIKKRFPTAQIILNRGFELLPKVHSIVKAVAAESLYGDWDQKNKQYREVNEEERHWLLAELEKVKKYDLPAIAIEFAPPENRNKAREIAEKVKLHGIIPWVTDGALATLGVGNIEVIPRKVLFLYDSEKSKDIDKSSKFHMTAVPLEYLGYSVIPIDIRKPLLKDILVGRYAGIMVWLDMEFSDVKSRIKPWLIHQIRQGVKVVILDSFGSMARDNDKLLNLQWLPRSHATKVDFSKKTEAIDYEIATVPGVFGFQKLRALAGDSWLQLKNNLGEYFDAIAIMPWGGYAISPYLLSDLPNQQARWVLNPFKFFSAALHQENMPVPDVTTENGRRLAMAHIDGDGFISLAEWHNGPYAGKMMLDDILFRYQIPTTVSIVQGEIAPNGLAPQLTKIVEPIAQEIFRLPWVEIASHTYSHPYDWLKIEKNPYVKKENLPLKKYVFDLNVEITGSANYINKQLAPVGKQCKVFLWSGEANPSSKGIKLSYDNNLRNMNGGNTDVTNENRSITNISPMGVLKDNYYQVYAPVTNENIYTNTWLGPFWGFRRVIETFEITEKPLRLKPIDIYFHFYSASKKASLAALHTIYEWLLSQDTFDVFISEFSDKVVDYQSTVIAKSQDGWLIRNAGHLKELRIPKKLGYPDLIRSKNVLGFNEHGDDFYIHLGPKADSQLQLMKSAPKVPYIYSANGVVTRFKRTKKGFTFALKGHMPLELSLANMQGCIIKQQQKPLKGFVDASHRLHYYFKDRISDALEVNCS